MTRKEMEDLLRRGNVDVDNFDQNSEKSLDELFEELRSHEVDLRHVPEDGVNPAHIARSAITVAISIFAPMDRVKYLETGRKYRSGKTSMRPRDWTITETLRRGESFHCTAVRALREETGLDVDNMVCKLYLTPFQDWPQPYDSSVYHGIKTHAMIHRVELWCLELPWNETFRLIHDQSKVVYVEMFPFMSWAAT